MECKKQVNFNKVIDHLEYYSKIFGYGFLMALVGYTLLQSYLLSLALTAILYPETVWIVKLSLLLFRCLFNCLLICIIIYISIKMGKRIREGMERQRVMQREEIINEIECRNVFKQIMIKENRRLNNLKRKNGRTKSNR